MGHATLARFLAVALCAAVVAGCTDGEASPPDPAPDPSPAASAFDLTVERVDLVDMDNAGIYGVGGPPPSSEAAEHAVAAARDALAVFLDAQLAAEGTRFSAGPIDQLLSARARGVVSDGDRAGLGQVALPVDHTVAGPATTVAQVLLGGDQVHAVTLAYTALFTVVLDGGASSPAGQVGSMTFLPTEEGWRADAVEVTTDLPEPPEASS